jgi:hypothetical protein
VNERDFWSMDRDSLSLIGKRLTFSVWKKWTPKQRAEAVDYAGACHFRASDNHVRVPDEPRWVKALPFFKLRFP